MSQLSDELRRIRANKISSLTPHELLVITDASEALDAVPAWHPRPTCAGLWVSERFHLGYVIKQKDVSDSDYFYWFDNYSPWYGPIPQPEKGGAS